MLKARLTTSLALIAVLNVSAAAAPPPEDGAHDAEEAHAEGGDAKKKGKEEEALTCASEEVGDWMISYDAYAFVAYNQAAEMTWKIQTHLDPAVSAGFLVKVVRPRRTAGYVRRPEVELWYNPPKVELENSLGEPYHAFGGALSHSYERAVGFGMRQLWIEPDQFWYPHAEAFNVKSSQTDARKAMTFEKTLAATDQKLRVELYLPMYSSSQPVGYGELEDTHGLAEAMKLAAARNYELYQLDAECRMTPLDLAPVEEKKAGGH